MTLDPFEPMPAHLRGGVVTIGNFDGWHAGHRRLLARTRARARELGVPAIVVTFDPHPRDLLRPETSLPPLLWPERKAHLARAAGADDVAILRTSREMLGLPPLEFLERILGTGLDVRGIVEGANFRFGQKRAGDVALLGRWCDERGATLDVVPMRTDDTSETVSSTRIRQALAEGDVATASRLLGRPHRVEGAVVRGHRRGRELGFPTANLGRVPVLLPEPGVYAVRAWVEGRSFAAACNVGGNPTFGEAAVRVETHLLDFDGDLYGKTLAIDLLERLRGVRAFANVTELADQVRQDAQAARRACERRPLSPTAERDELVGTIAEWLRLDIEPGLIGVGARLLRCRWEPAAGPSEPRLVVQWHFESPLPPAELHVLLDELPERLRGVFPEADTVVSIADPPTATGG